MQRKPQELDRYEITPFFSGVPLWAGWKVYSTTSSQMRIGFSSYLLQVLANMFQDSGIPAEYKHTPRDGNQLVIQDVCSLQYGSALALRGGSVTLQLPTVNLSQFAIQWLFPKELKKMILEYTDQEWRVRHPYTVENDFNAWCVGHDDRRLLIQLDQDPYQTICKYQNTLLYNYYEELKKYSTFPPSITQAFEEYLNKV